MLPQPFQFTQSSLQDYVDCARRFQLRYINSLAWPAVRAEPLLEHEQQIERGIRFHRLVERHQLGIDPGLLETSIQDDTLRGWWQSYLRFDRLHKQKSQRHAELSLSMPMRDARLAAKFDLVAIVPEQRAIIYDWKTYTRPPQREWFAHRLQTRIYPLVLLHAGTQLFGGSLRAEQIQMVYWIAGTPEQPVIFDYSDEQAAQDAAYVTELITEIANLPNDDIWPLTADETHFRFCENRSLCERGVRAGHLDDSALQPDEDVPPLVRLADVEEVGF